jgi:hypothetical protein
LSKKFFVICGIIILSLIPITTTIKPAKAFSLSYPELHQYVTGNETYEDENFGFLVTNDENEPITIKPFGEVLNFEEWEKYFTISWNVSEIKIQPEESVYFRPTIEINTDLTYDYFIHFVFTAYKEIENKNVLVSALGGTAIFTVFSGNEGIKLHLRTVDQADRERNSHIEIHYKAKEQDAWSIQKTLQTSSYKSIIPVGFYWIKAIEHLNKIEKSEYFTITKDSDINIVFELVLFSNLFIYTPRQPNEKMDVSYTINNDYQTLSNVLIRFVLYREDKSIVYQTSETKNHFDTKTFTGNFSILDENGWKTQKYLFVAQIWVNGEIYVFRNETLDLTMPFLSDLVKNPYINTGLPIMVLVLIGMLIQFLFAKYGVAKKIKNKVRQIRTIETETQKNLD